MRKSIITAVISTALLTGGLGASIASLKLTMTLRSRERLHHRRKWRSCMLRIVPDWRITTG